jgi:hypothetical protein
MLAFDPHLPYQAQFQPRIFGAFAANPINATVLFTGYVFDFIFSDSPYSPKPKIFLWATKARNRGARTPDRGP